MSRRLCLVVALFIPLCSLSAHAASKNSGQRSKPDQEVARLAAKSGLHGQQLRELATAMKQDKSLGEKVKGAIAKGLRGRELADFVHKEIQSPQDQTSASDPSATAGKSAGQGMKGQGMQGQGMMGQGPMMRQGMMGQGMGMGSGPAMGGSGMGMNRGAGGCGMAAGKTMRGGR
jgi:hypothetical protein